MSNTYRNNQCAGGCSKHFKASHCRRFAKITKRNSQRKKRTYNRKLVNSGNTELSSADTRFIHKSLTTHWATSRYVPHKEQINVPNMKYQSTHSLPRNLYPRQTCLKEKLQNELDVINLHGSTYETRDRHLYAKATLKQIERRGSPSMYKGRSRLQSARRLQKEHIVIDQ